MSDTGKVMIGTDGNPLRGADGKIVLADVKYPIILLAPIKSTAYWSRSVLEVSHTADSIWGTSWSEGYDIVRRLHYPSSYTGSLSTHTIAKYSLQWLASSGDTVPWTRTVPLKLSIKVTATNLSLSSDDWANPENLSLRVWYSFASQDDPAGHEEIWDRDDWFEAGASTAMDIEINKNLTLSQTPPASLWVAIFCDPTGSDLTLYTDDDVGYEIEITGASVTVGQVITYNLAG